MPTPQNIQRAIEQARLNGELNNESRESGDDVPRQSIFQEFKVITEHKDYVECKRWDASAEAVVGELVNVAKRAPDRGFTGTYPADIIITAAPIVAKLKDDELNDFYVGWHDISAIPHNGKPGQCITFIPIGQVQATVSSVIFDWARML